MMMKTIRMPAALLAGALALAAPPGASAQTNRPTPGFNLFSVEQDIEIGRQSAVEAERQLALLDQPDVNRYLTSIISRLAAQAPGTQYPYTIKAVNDSSINAFALPGGPMYVNRGLFDAARNEAELAGVLAHEMSHVVLRHGTHQASKAYLTQSGLGILGGLLGKSDGNGSKILNAVGGVGLNVAFLKFGRDDEYQADQLGAEIMAGAGYSPVAMANFFELLRAEQGRDPGKLETFLSSHPASADREARIRTQAKGLRVTQSREVGGFAGLRTRLRRLPAAPNAPGQAMAADNPSGSNGQDHGRYEVNVPAPSTRFQQFDQKNGLFTISYPDNWRTYGSDSGYAVSMAPEGGVVETANGQQAMLYGVIINHYSSFEGDTDRRVGSASKSYAPFEDTAPWAGSLESATDDLVRQLIRSNSYLRAQEGQARRELIDGRPSYTVLLSGSSPVTGQEERVTVVTRSLSDSHVIYALSITPGNGDRAMTDTFTRMLRSMTVNDEAAHRGVSGVGGNALTEGRVNSAVGGRPADAAGAAVRRVYLDLLQREPDPQGLALYRNRMNNEHWSEQQVREALLKSPEYRRRAATTRQRNAEDLVARAYLTVLNREPDPASRVYVDKVLRENWTEADVTRELRNSPEYRNRR